MALNLLKIGVQPKQSDSSETKAADPTTSPAVQPSTNPAPSPAPEPSASVAREPSATSVAAKPVGLGAFLQAAKAGKPIQAPTPTEIHPPAEPVARLEVPVVESRGPENFQETLKKLDAMIGEAMRVEQTDFDIVRGYVATVSKELKEMPEYRGFVRAKDMHNIMKFIQASSSQAVNQFKVSAEKKEKASTRKKASSNFSLAAFGDDVPVKKGFNLEALSSMNTDDVPVKSR